MLLVIVSFPLAEGGRNTMQPSQDDWRQGMGGSLGVRRGEEEKEVAEKERAAQDGWSRRSPD